MTVPPKRVKNLAQGRENLQGICVTFQFYCAKARKIESARQQSEQLFHTGWFVESLATQTLVIFVIRTAGNPFRSRPSVALTATTIAVVMAGIVIPFTSLGRLLGFVPLPFAFFIFLAGASVTYLLLVEVVKRKLMRRLLG